MKTQVNETVKDDPTRHHDDYPTCRVCGSHDVEWFDCERCGGEGHVEYDDCPEEWGEDCPSEENHLITCSECRGKGGYWFCHNGANHPRKECEK